MCSFRATLKRPLHVQLIDGEVFAPFPLQATASGTGQACGGGERSVDGTAGNTRQKNEGIAAGSRTGRLVLRYIDCSSVNSTSQQFVFGLKLSNRQA